MNRRLPKGPAELPAARAAAWPALVMLLMLIGASFVLTKWLGVFVAAGSALGFVE